MTGRDPAPRLDRLLAGRAPRALEAAARAAEALSTIRVAAYRLAFDEVLDRITVIRSGPGLSGDPR